MAPRLPPARGFLLRWKSKVDGGQDGHLNCTDHSCRPGGEHPARKRHARLQEAGGKRPRQRERRAGAIGQQPPGAERRRGRGSPGAVWGERDRPRKAAVAPGAPVGERQEPAGDPARPAGGGLLPHRRPARHARDRQHGAAGHRAALLPGDARRPRRREAASHGQHHGHRVARWRQDGDPAQGAGARRYRAAFRRGHGAGGHAPAFGQGPVPQPGRADRRIHAGGEER